MTNNNKYSTEEGLKELTRSLLMMKYDNSKTLNEQLTLLGGPSMLAGQIAATQKVGELVKKGSNFVYRCSKSFANDDMVGFSECLTTLRDKMYTMEGLSITAAVEVLGAEIGIPILVEDLGYLFLLNDSKNFIITYKSPPKNMTIDKKFMWLWENNKNFVRVIEDILFLLFNVVGPYIAKGGSKILGELLTKLGGSEGGNIFVKLGKWFLSKSAKSTQPFVKRFISSHKKGLTDIAKIFEEDLGATAAKVVSKTIPAAITGALTYVLGNWISEKFSGVIKKYQEEKNIRDYSKFSIEEYERHLLVENSNIFGNVSFTIPKKDNGYNIDFYFNRTSNGEWSAKFDSDGDGTVDGPFEIRNEENPELFKLMNAGLIIASTKDFLSKYFQSFSVISPKEFCINSKYYKEVEPNTFKIKEYKDVNGKCNSTYQNPYKSDWMGSQSVKPNLTNVNYR